MLAYTGIETISNMAEEARDETKTIPIAINRVRIAVFAIYFTLPSIALSALPVARDADGEYFTTLLGVAEEDGGYAGDPILGIVKQIDLGALQAAGEIYVGLLAATILFAGHQRGRDRRLAARLLDGHAPPAARPAAPAAPAATARRTSGSCSSRASPACTLLPGQEDFLGTSTRSARCCRSRSPTWR